MGFTLKIKRLLFLFSIYIIAIIPFSCGSTKQQDVSGSIVNKDKNSLSSEQLKIIDEFKLAVFTKCLEIGFAENNATKILHKDASQRQEFLLGFEGYRIVDSIAWDIRQQIIKDSIVLSEISELQGRKPVLRVCLKAYTSQKLDSLAIKFVTE